MASAQGSFYWNELMTRDPDVARAYYEKTCGWSFEPMRMGDDSSDYLVASKGGVPIAGIMDMRPYEHMNDLPPHWFIYIAVEDVDLEATATETAGGKVMREPFDVPGVGRIAIVTDPTGAAFGLITPADTPGA